MKDLSHGFEEKYVVLGRSMRTKTWLWWKKNSEKILIDMNEYQSSARTMSDAKDDFIHKQEKEAKEAIAGWEEAPSLKQKLDDALLLKSIAEEKITSIDATLKECVKQLHSIKSEQQLNILKASQERERTRALEEMLEDATKRLNLLSAEKSNLCGILLSNQNMIKDLSSSKSQLEADFAAIAKRLDSSERSNESLKHEIIMLQKELELRIQEIEFIFKSYKASQKQHIENVWNIEKLESECQRLNVLIRKRLPCPAAIKKMRNEVEMLCKSATETGRRRSNPAMDPYLPRDFVPKVGDGTSCKTDDRLQAVEKENKILKERLASKISELQISRVMFARTASKLSQSEKKLTELSKDQACLELAQSSSMTCELAQSGSEIGGKEDNSSCAESWASALMSQLEQFRNGKPANPLVTTEPLESSLMNDNIETDGKTPKAIDLKQETKKSLGKELIPSDDYSNFGKLELGDQSGFSQFEKEPGWLKDIVKVILQKRQTTQLSLDVILQEVRIALCDSDELIKGRPLDQWLSGELGSRNLLKNKIKNQLQLNLENVLHRIIKLTDGFIRRIIPDYEGKQLSLSGQDADPSDKPALSNGQIASVFLWESSEVIMVLRRLITVCNNVFCGTAEVEKFVCELASTLEWMFDHCFSLQGVSTMEESIRQYFNNDFSCCVDDTLLEVSNFNGAKLKTSAPDRLQIGLGNSIPNGLHILSQMEETESKFGDENSKLMDKIENIESAKKDREEKFKSETAQNHSLVTPLKESGNNMSNLQSELRSLKDSKGLTERVEDQKLMSNGLKTQLMTARVELNEANQKFHAPETGPAEKNNHSEELEATCLELQLHIESVSGKDKPKYEMVEEEKESKTEREIAAASEKLAECQETILKLGKQLRALASLQDTALFDKAASSPVVARTSHYPQLFDQLLAIEHAKFDDHRSPQAKETLCNGHKSSVRFVSNTKNSIMHALQAESPDSYNEMGKPHEEKWGTEVGSLVIVPKKKKGGIGFLRRLLPGNQRDQ
ncbi:hypothetical protein HPP92_014767 [Vanilla planifolia]|uniref:Filament-like plant protein 7 n=1 Tax=Vanilla planifolia TaxID=51239 RepID=A0A835QQ57_VANPL|nr:hypothetical protein HPP92_014767 [Vanilla planifolia]